MRTPAASTPATRHVMQANRSKDTGPELKVRSALREAGLPGYRIHWKGAPGRPDVCYPGRRVAIFVHGCYWHRCPMCALPLPRSNTEFWREKFERNRARDARDNAALVSRGWTVVVVWECQLKGARAARTMSEVASIVRLAGKGGARGREGRLVEVGVTPAWKRARTRERLRAGRAGSVRAR